MASSSGYFSEVKQCEVMYSVALSKLTRRAALPPLSLSRLYCFSLPSQKFLERKKFATDSRVYIYTRKNVFSLGTLLPPDRTALLNHRL
jgi:hypothetical protein